MNKTSKTMEEFLDSLTPKAKNWFAKAIAGAVTADGIIERYEIEFLKQILSFLDNPDDVTTLLDLVKSMNPPKLEPLHIEKEQGIIILKYLLQFIIIDDDLHPEEERFFRKATALLGFPPHMADKFLKIADHLTKVAIQCRVQEKGKIEDVRCIYIGLESCVLSMKRVLNPRTLVSLRFYPPESDSKTDSKLLYAPITGKIHRFDKKKEGIIYIKILYTHPVTINHGVPQYYDPESYQKAVQPLPAKNKSLSGIKVQCRSCGQKNIPFWSLKKGSMAIQDNIFGTTVYKKAHSDFEDCDYNRIQVIICPNCFFSSTLETLFHKQGTWPLPLPFDMKHLIQQWNQAYNQHKKKITDLGKTSWITAEIRTGEQAIMTFDFAIETHELLSSCDLQNNQMFHQTLIGVYLMIQAELLMGEGKSLEADQKLYQVIQHIEPIFSKINPIMQVRMARSLGIIHLYRREREKFSRYRAILENMLIAGKFKQNSPGDKTLQVCLEAMKHADQNSEQYQKGSRTDFQRAT